MAKRPKRKEIPPPLKCIFCKETRKMSREHIWAEWMSKVIPKQKGAQRTTRTAYFRGPTELKHQQGDEAGRKVLAACKVCNETWMSQIETAAIPVATPLLLGQTIELTPEIQNTLATWLALKAMVCEFLYPHSVVASDFTRNQFLETRKPDANDWQIWLGYFDLPTHKHYQAVTFNIVESSKVAQVHGSHAIDVGKSATMIFGRMIAYVAFCEIPFLRGFNLAPEFRPKLTRIWPTGTSFTWPNTPALGLGEAGPLTNTYFHWASRTPIVLPRGVFITDFLRK
jgi:hypothetical protein